MHAYLRCHLHNEQTTHLHPTYLVAAFFCFVYFCRILFFARGNRYAQVYLDTSGVSGDLRVSTIVAGDPVIVGAVFVHKRL
jgi:hypothetical protein